MSQTSSGPQSQAAQDSATIVKYPRSLVIDGVVNPLSAGAGVQLPVPLTIPQDADFEWWWLSIFRTSAQLKVQIAEGATGGRTFIYGSNGSNQLQSGAFQGIFVDALAGLIANNGAFPMAVPFVMPSARTYQHTFTDLSGAANTVEMVYGGYALLQIGSD
jgi:hypothetical protein